MLSSMAFIHAIPAYIFAYAGFRSIFGHNVALSTTIVIATFVLFCTTIFPNRIKVQLAKKLADRRDEQS